MARAWDSISQNPETTAISLTRLVARLEQKVLAPENEPTLVRSEFERAKASTNLEYARTLLLRLEHDSSTIKIQSRKQNVQADLQSKRDRIKQLNRRLQELDRLAVDEDDDREQGDDIHEDSGIFSEPRNSPSHLLAADTTDDTDTGQQEQQDLTGDPITATSSKLRSRNPRAPGLPSTATGSTLFPPNFNQPKQSTNVEADPTLSQTEALLSHNRSEQENLTDSLLNLASQFKSSALQFSSSLESEKDILARAASGLDKNALGMEAAGSRMGTLRRMTEGKGWWARLKIYGLIGALWIIALVIVFVLPKLRF